MPDAGARSGYVYVSGYGGMILTFTFDPVQATLTPKGTPTRVSMASFLAWTTPTHQLFALSEVTAGRVFGFSVNPANGALTATNDVASGGAGPAHLLADPSGKWVLVANYDSGQAAVLGVQSNGNLVASAQADVQSFGANAEAHNFVLDPSSQYAFVALKGSDAVAQFKFDSATGKVTPSTPPRVATATGAGPRHIAFHPSGKFAYVINEQASTMVAYTHNAGVLTEMQNLSTRMATGAGNTGAEVAMHPSGKWLYGSNRGDNNIVQYSIGDTDGKMTFVGVTPSGGNTPRHFSIDPTGQFIFVANQDSDNVVVFRIGAADGKLTRAGNPTSVTGAQPTFVAEALLP
jgi:6-phosphogluconolactonase